MFTLSPATQTGSYWLLNVLDSGDGIPGGTVTVQLYQLEFVYFLRDATLVA